MQEIQMFVFQFLLQIVVIFFMQMKMKFKRKIAQKAKFKVIEDYDIDFLKDKKIAKILYEKRDMD